MRSKPLCLGLFIPLALAVASDPLQGSVRLATLCNFREIGRPTGRLLQDNEGNFYGTASGTEYVANRRHVHTSGAVFKISPQGQLLWQLQFPGTNDVFPAAGLFQDEEGFLYGTTFYGGIQNQGTVFKVSANGRFVWSTPFRGANGAGPFGELVRGCDGFLFGTTVFGGARSVGTVFRLTSEGVIKTIYSFGGTDGAHPSAGPVHGVDGYFYGTTQFGGSSFTFPFASGEGTIFRISCDGTLTTLYKFGNPTNLVSGGFGLNGSYPTGQLIQRNDGCFYGVAEGGLTSQGTNFWATIFKFDPNGTLITLLYFNTSQHDGADPAGPLVTSNDGGLYGATAQGGASADDGSPGYGTIFKITQSGIFLNLVSFYGTNGCNPFSGPIKGKDGNLYGTTHGNYYFPGTFFRVSISRPVVSIARPQQIVHPTNAVVTVTGQTKSLASVLDVFYQLNGGDWIEATTTNEWKNWAATVTLSSPKNILRAYAIDSSGDLSRTNRMKLLFVQP